MNDLNNQITLRGNNATPPVFLPQETQTPISKGNILVPPVESSINSVFNKITAISNSQLSPESLADLKKCINKLDPKNKLRLSKKLNTITLSRLDVNTTNFVFKVNQKVNQYYSTIAYFKVSKREEASSAALEKLMWKISGIMGIKHNLVRTKTIQLTFTDSDTSTLVNGSIQPSVEGKLLKDFFNDKNFSLYHVSDKEIFLAILTSYILGMFDAHGANIMITPEGKIKFFDNARSLPNANGLISWGANSWEPKTSYRCALLDLWERVSKVLEPKTKNELLEKARFCKQHLGLLNNYLENDSGKKLIDKLPPGWIIRGEMMEAIENRIDCLIDRLESDQPFNVLELVVGGNQSYKLCFAVSFVARKSQTFSPETTRESLLEKGKRSHAHVNKLNFKDCVNLLNLFNCSLEHLIAICENTPDIITLINRLVDLFFEKRENDLEKLTFDNFETFTKITQNNHFELKEHDRSHSAKGLIEAFNKSSLHKLGYTVHLCDVPSQMSFKIDNKKFILQSIVTGRMYLCVWTDIGMRMKPISLHHTKGMAQVKRGSKVILAPLAELDNEMSEESGEPLLDEFPIPYKDAGKANLFKIGNEIQIMKQDKSVIIFYKDKNGVTKSKRTPSNDTKDSFRAFNKTFTLLELSKSFINQLRIFKNGNNN